MILLRPLIGILILLHFASAASAQNAIGGVALAEREVTGTIAGKTAALKNNQSVVQNEVIGTGADSFARIAFHDLTTLSLGPQARVTLDRYVFNPDSTASQISLNATRGIFRFVTGSTPSRNIAIRTPSATIGVRGTIIDIKVARSREIVVLQEGATRVCVGSTCKDITVPGEGVIIAGRSITGPSTAAALEFNFDAETKQRFRMHMPYSVVRDGAGSSGSPGESSSSGSNSSSSSGVR